MMNLTLLIAISCGMLGTGITAQVSPGNVTTEAPSVRALAEIDNDPTTFTRDEQQKFAVLTEVLGTAPIAPDHDLAKLGS